MECELTHKTMKLLEKVIGEILQNLQFGEYVSDVTLKVWSIKEKNTGFQQKWKTLLCEKPH